MDELELNKLIDAWLAYYSDAAEVSDREQYSWARDQINDWNPENPEQVWRFILGAYKRWVTDKQISDLAAGPLEDLIADHGAAFIDRIETLARKDRKFKHMLRGVWQKGGPDDIWARVVKAQK
jgi:hypothetical protein